MLRHLSIQHYTIIEHLDLEFKSGMTVFTGETGAGKSILIDALLLALGGRADSKAIAKDAERCHVSADFVIDQHTAAQQWLSDHELNVDRDCQLRRIVTHDGRSRGFINGQPVPLQQLRELGSLLINIHGQHEHHSLLKNEQQRSLLDHYAGNHALLKKIQDIYFQLRKTEEEFNTLENSANQKEARIELLQYQLKEFDHLAPQPNEFEKLEQELRQLANVDNLMQSSQSALNLLSESEKINVVQLLNKVLSLLNDKQQLDPKLKNSIELVNNALIQIDEAVSELQTYCNCIDADPERLQNLEQRLSQLHELARKHRIKPEVLVEHHQLLTNELKQLENSNISLEKLREEIVALRAQYHEIAGALTQNRVKAAKIFAAAIEKSIRELGMPGGRFTVKFEQFSVDEFTMYGAERLEFFVSANPGQELQALNKVASGGELSRISLAIQVLTAKNNSIPSLIFDEVDVGIGGGTAEIVGRLLRQLANDAQVLCVTHLPQVAALAHHHFQVEKRIHNNITKTEVRFLDKSAKIQEVARMLGGVKITKQTLAHAQEMVDISG